jgi:hypothetical protein
VRSQEKRRTGVFAFGWMVGADGVEPPTYCV